MAFGVPSVADLKSMFGFVTPEDRARWQQQNSLATREDEKKMFARLAEGLTSSGQRLSDGRLTSEQNGRSITHRPRKVTRVITEHISAEDDLDAPFDY